MSSVLELTAVSKTFNMRSEVSKRSSAYYQEC